MSKPEPTQRPGCLPEGYTLDSILSLEQWGTWMGYAPAYARRKIRSIRDGVIRQGGRPKIHPRTYLWAKGGAFRDALTDGRPTR